MRQNLKRGFLSLLVLFCPLKAAFAQAVALSARQMEPGTWRALVYYQGVDSQDLRFSLSSGGSCAGGAAAPAANVSFPCGSTGNIVAEGDGGALLLKVVHQPGEGLQYYFSAGLGNYSLRVASVSVANALSGDRPGYLYSAGVRAVLWPDTVAGPGLAADFGIGWQRYYFNTLQPALTAAGSQIEQRLDLLQTSLALEASHLFKREGERLSVEPYGGLRWTRTRAWLKDLKAGGRGGGYRDALAPFLGLHLPVYDREGLFAEVSFLNGIQYAAGLNIGFK